VDEADVEEDDDDDDDDDEVDFRKDVVEQNQVCRECGLVGRMDRSELNQ
jgi:hypothetical protein